jgi:hypothetical protein
MDERRECIRRLRDMLIEMRYRKAANTLLELDANIENNNVHFAIDKFLDRYDIDGNIVREYRNLFEQFMFKGDDNYKIWMKNGKTCRYTKDENGLTLPARIINANGISLMEWFRDGKLYRDDLDENGYTLPNTVSDRFQSWRNENGLQHREEFDADGNLLHSRIEADGRKSYAINGKWTTPEYYKILTNLRNRHPILREMVESLMKKRHYEQNTTHIKINKLIADNNLASDTIDEYYITFELYMFKKTKTGKTWFRGIHRHRLNGPAIERSDGGLEWFKNGLSHRDERDDGLTLPAKILADGTKIWCKNGISHRDDRDAEGFLLPAKIYPTGQKEWFKNGLFHNDDRDANNKLLPALVCADGRTFCFINGEDQGIQE